MPESFPPPDAWYLIDTVNDERKSFKDRAELQQAAHRMHAQLNLIPVGDLYSKYWFSWFDYLALALLFGPPCLAMLFLVRYILRTRLPDPSTVRLRAVT